tara:strand:+ start:4859 stop:5338 length:480 start_codon:yes stop_codon:yes gene_type:complete
MNLYKSLSAIYSYLHGIRKHEDYFIIDLSLPTNWQIPNKTIDNVGVKVYKNTDTIKIISFYTVFGEETCGTLMEVINEVIRLNKEREEKDSLLHEKRVELEKLFNSNNLDSLKNMSFMFNNVNEYYEKFENKLTSPDGEAGERTEEKQTEPTTGQEKSN